MPGAWRESKGKRRLAGDTSRAANTDEVRDLRREARDLKEVVAEQMLENRLLKKTYGPPLCKSRFIDSNRTVCVKVCGISII